MRYRARGTGEEVHGEETVQRDTVEAVGVQKDSGTEGGGTE